MNASTFDGNGVDPLRPRPPGGMGSGAVLALAVHALLVLALAVSLSWRSHAPQEFSAELWAAAPQRAAPKAVEPPPQPAPPPAPAPAPEPPKRVEPPAPPLPDAQIAVEKARKQAELEEQQRLDREKAEREKLRREKLEREKAEREKAQREKAEREKAQREKAEREKQERDKAEREKAARDKAEAEKREKAEQARLAKQREENLKRALGQADATGSPAATGTAARDAGPSATYAGKVVARVRPNILLTETLSGKPAAEVEVRAAPNGTILSRRLVKSSGNKDWDDAVLRAIDRTGELPRDVDGRVPPVLVISFTP